MALDQNWFTEIENRVASAFSLKIREKLHEEQTPYQKIEIYQTEAYGNLMVIDGFIMLSGFDNFLYHEIMSHPVLFSHPQPEQVLIIGGGDCGTLQQVLLHPEVKKVWQVEIDERVTRLAQQYFPDLCQSNNDPRAELLFVDGIEWITNKQEDSLDVIIVDSTDPIGAAEGLFAAPFYKQCLRALKPGGLLIQQSESPLIHMNLLKGMYGEMNKAGFESIASLNFPQSVYPSGWWSATMAAKVSWQTLETGTGTIPWYRRQAALNKPFETQFYNAAIHEAAFARPEFMKKALD